MSEPRVEAGRFGLRSKVTVRHRHAAFGLDFTPTLRQSFPSMNLHIRAALASAGAMCVLLSTSARADEGMWLYSAPPRAAIEAKYGFKITDAWLDHLMKSSVRFNSGGSGSFVSADGLVITNHHVGADDLQKLSDEKHNYLKDGFYAATSTDEKKCVDLELNVLQSIEDVTARVNAGVPAGATGDDAAKARRAVMAGIEKESREKTGLRSDVVTLYQGGAYHLYRFKRYTDIRLVFAPEQQAAFFGGDPDNFEYPRYDLDVCLFRVYENGQPAKIEHFLKFSTTGTKDGELTFVSGHPGRTERQFTMDELMLLRDTQYPYAIPRLKQIEVLLTSWSGRSEENARRARETLFSVQNSRKVYDGLQAGLYSPSIMDAKAKAEATFRSEMNKRPDGADVIKAYDSIAKAVQDQARIYKRYRMLEGGNAFMSDSFGIARQLLRAGDERPKANGERLREFGDAKRESLELELFSDKPIYTDYEILTLADALTSFAATIGYHEPVVQAVLAGKSPRERAADLINTTQVRDVAFRKKLYEGGAAAVSAAHDPMIEVARMIDAEARGLRKEWEAYEEARRQAHGIIEKMHFTLEGTSRAPDATFTLRLSYGPVKGYAEAGQQVPAYTNIAGLYARSAAQHNHEPFDLPPRWVEKRAAVNPDTPFNFVSTADIIGGNSGSPVVNTAGEFVGIIFDGNLQSLVLDFAYEDVQARALSVDCRAILEAMRKVYGVDALANELVAGHR